MKKKQKCGLTLGIFGLTVQSIDYQTLEVSCTDCSEQCDGHFMLLRARATVSIAFVCREGSVPWTVDTGVFPALFTVSVDMPAKSLTSSS